MEAKVGDKLVRTTDEGNSIFAVVMEVYEPDEHVEHEDEQPMLYLDLFDDQQGYGFTQCALLDEWVAEVQSSNWKPYNGTVFECITHGIHADPATRPPRGMTASLGMIDVDEFFKVLNEDSPKQILLDL